MAPSVFQRLGNSQKHSGCQQRQICAMSRDKSILLRWMLKNALFRGEHHSWWDVGASLRAPESFAAAASLKPPPLAWQHHPQQCQGAPGGEGRAGFLLQTQR